MSADPASPGSDAQIESAARDYPLRRSKIERPILPLETLRRDRLLDWLDATIRRRLILVVAEAGFGKTTLLADFARRTRFRTIWYRVDEDDIDPITFLRYFIAACQTIDSELLSRSASLLAEAATRPVTWESILECVCQELTAVASEPTVIFFDDYHLAEPFAHVRQIVERLIARAPERVSFVVAGRRTPNLAVARLRACDDLAELGREELRFEPRETERLFREVYSQPLETDLLTDLQARTDGWVASLQLVKAAVRGRSAGDVREFIATLSAGEGELYDYLAEEVIADLPDETQRFLSRVSILAEIEPPIAAPAADMEPSEARVQLTAAQRLGLVTRTARVLGPARLHPLVREFLEARLTSEIGEAGVRALHRRVAVLYEPISWRSAARHWAAAGDGDDVCRVVQSATGTILGTGEFEAADDYITRFAGTAPNPWFDILRSRVAYARREPVEAERLGQRAREAIGDDTRDQGLRQVVSLHSLYMAFEAHDGPGTVALALGMANEALDEEAAAIAAALAVIAEDEDLREAAARTRRVLSISRARGRTRYEGIAELNLASYLRILGDLQGSLSHAETASRMLSDHGTPDERGAAKMSRAQALVHLGCFEEAVCAATEAMQEWPGAVTASEAAELLCMYGDVDDAERLLHESMPSAPRLPGEQTLVRLARARILMLQGRLDEARRVLPSGDDPRPVYCGYGANHAAASAMLAVLEGHSAATTIVADALSLCERQGALFWWRIVKLLDATIADPSTLNRVVESHAGDNAVLLSVVAEPLLRRGPDLSDRSRSLIEQEVSHRPARWRGALRRYVSSDMPTRNAVVAARWLELIGDVSDIQLLSRVAKDARRRTRAAGLGRQLVRRLAPRYVVEDLGPVSLVADARCIVGASIRRKVLALLCFLLTRPRYAATTDQVIEALWPGLDPATGSNSLNQTVYFLRRVLEPSYEDQVTAGYIQHEADLIWLDGDLVSSRSRQCSALMDELANVLEPPKTDLLAQLYVAPFALDFAYEDWATSYRESLHARYLSVMEKAIKHATEAGALEYAIALAQKVLRADPGVEQIELALLRLYRRTGAQSAAAEQYSHYAAAYRDETGLECPPLEAL